MSEQNDIKIEWEDINPTRGDHMTLDNFIKYCERGSFIDYDGFGKYATKDKVSNKVIYPSDVTGTYSDFDYKTSKFHKKTCEVKIDRSFTHVVWYNR